MVLIYHTFGAKKMTTLYNLGEDLNETVEQIQDLLEDGISPDDERVQGLLEKMVAQEENWDSKAIRVAKYLNQLSADEKQIDAEIDRLTKRKKSTANAHSSLHDLLMWQMRNFGKDEIKDATISIKFKENPVSVLIHDESMIPAQYKKEKVTVTVDKIALKKAHAEGFEIDGAVFVRNKKLAIK